MSDGYEIVIAPRPIDPKLGGELSQIIARITHRRTHRPDTSIMEATGCNEEQLVEIVLTFLRKVENYTVTEVNAGKRGTREIAHLPLNIEGIELFFQKIAERW